MERMEEYRALQMELTREPEVLAGSVERARRRARQRRRLRRLITWPAAGLAGLAASFVLLVNVSAPATNACAQVPFLARLAEAVSFSGTLERAVENDYVQPVGIVQTKDGMTLSVEYLIVDQKQVHVFYSLSDEAGRALSLTPQEVTAAGEKAPCAIVSGYGTGADGEALRHFTMDFTEGDVPGELTVTCMVDALETVLDQGWQETATTFTFDLTFDPDFVAQGETVAVGETLTLDGQTFTLEAVEFYPTHMRLNFSEDEHNTAWLKSLEFTVALDGEDLGTPSSGITATGSPDTPSMLSYRAASPWFAEGSEVTITITGARWLQKDCPPVTVDLTNGTAENLPEGVTLQSVEDGVLTFHQEGEEDWPVTAVFAFTFQDPQGGEHEMESIGAGAESGGFYNMLTLPPDYPYDQLLLQPAYTAQGDLAQPVTVTVTRP